MKTKKLGVYFVVSMLMVSFVFVAAGIQVYAAEVGDQLAEPESGWKRYDDTDGKIIYNIGNWLIDRSNVAYNNTTHYTVNGTASYKFRAKCTKFRIIGTLWNNNSKNINMKIDGVDTTYSQYSESNTRRVLVFESNALNEGIHHIEVSCSDGAISIDAIDVDDNGELVEYKEPSPDTIMLDIEPEKEKIKVNEIVTADLVIDNISKISAEDIKIKYDNQKLKYLGSEEVDGMKLVKSVEKTETGDLRVIVASKGEANIIDSKKILLKLKFKGIKVGDALVDITKGRVTDGIDMEKDLADKECDQGIIVIEAVADVNNSGEFTLLDLGIDARHFSKDPTSSELAKYNTDIVINGEIDDADLLEIGKLILENSNYDFNE